MIKIISFVLIAFFPIAGLCADSKWEKQGDYYYLAKKARDNFSLPAAGVNKFIGKYLSYDGVDFLARGADDWKDYGRLNLEGNNLFLLPIRQGIKVKEVHFLTGGNFGNSYEHDQLLRLYGDNYYYAVVSVIFIFQDGVYKSLSVPIFWDWFRMDPGAWSKDGASIKYVGYNPVRKDCSMFHMSFVNPRPQEPLKDILVSDSWLNDRPFSEIFAVTIKSADQIEAMPREDRNFKIVVKDAAKEPADQRREWMFNNDLDGWISGCSENWNAEVSWLADSYGRKGAVVIPACNLGGDKFSWIEKKISLPDWDKILFKFLRHSAAYSQLDKLWSDGLLRVIVRQPGKPEVAYEKLYGGDWSSETADLSRYKGKTVIIRLENHGAGQVRLGPSTSSVCDAEDAIIDNIILTR
ncbi:MAG: hypothetical protein V2A64_07670 [Candidatus Omnitrophota bacterium]